MPDYTPLTFQQVIEEAVRVTLADGYHSPMVFVIGSRQSALNGMSDMPPTSELRQQLMAVIGYEMSREALGQLVRVITVFEAWQSKTPDVLPSESPDRVEVLMLSCFEVRGRRLDIVTFEMIRDGQDELIDLRLMTDSRREPDFTPESPLMDAFMWGYHQGRRGRLPPMGGGRG